MLTNVDKVCCLNQSRCASVSRADGRGGGRGPGGGGGGGRDAETPDEPNPNYIVETLNLASLLGRLVRHVDIFFSLTGKDFGKYRSVTDLPFNNHLFDTYRLSWEMNFFFLNSAALLLRNCMQQAIKPLKNIAQCSRLEALRPGTIKLNAQQDLAVGQSVGQSAVTSINNCLTAPRYRVSQSRNHRDVLFELDVLTTKLNDHDFVAQDGVHTKALLGAKGIGKSHCLRLFCHTLPSRQPQTRVIPIYIECIEPSELSFKSILTQVGSAAILDLCQKNGNLSWRLLRDAYDAFFKTDMAALQDMLYEENFRVLFVADEVETLWGATQAQHKAAAIASTNLLKRLAAHKDGLFATVICGSTSSLPELLTNKPTIDRDRFPLLGTPNLNSSKFQDLRVLACLPTDLDAVKCQLEVYMPDKPEKARYFRKHPNSVSFFAGSNPRMINSLLDNSSQADKANIALNVFFHHSAAQSSWEVYGPCIIRLHQAMLNSQANRELLASILRDEEDRKALLNWQSKSIKWQRPAPLLVSGCLEAIDWEKFKPLAREDAEKIVTESKELDSSGLAPVGVFKFLHDRSWLVGNKRGVHHQSSEFYPTTFAALLVAAAIDPESLSARQFIDQIADAKRAFNADFHTNFNFETNVNVKTD
eukprot:TRINITY_DN12391_c3_g1_i22.p2 TRINITY_DN12391_c3_g1~~TRINITY_DN12391_c3_g1_i22.p2  ORF type:complete len:645 (+),score=32.81 TRINITY_DN12391_c3_g1_i22:2042-3976(+)